MLTADQRRVYSGPTILVASICGTSIPAWPEGAEAPRHDGRISAHPPPAAAPRTAKVDAKLTRAEIFRQVQDLINADTTVIAETRFLVQRRGAEAAERRAIRDRMQWGSIGWAIPATFGYAVGASSRRTVP